MKKLIITLLAFIFSYANYVVLDTNYQTPIDGKVAYLNGKYYNAIDNDKNFEINVYNYALKKIKTFHTPHKGLLESIFPLNNHIYFAVSKKITNLKSKIYIYKLVGDKLYLVKKLKPTFCPGNIMINADNNYISFTTLLTDSNGRSTGGEFYIYNKNFSLVRKKELKDEPSWTYLQGDKFIYSFFDGKKIYVYWFLKDFSYILSSDGKLFRGFMKGTTLYYTAFGSTGKEFRKHIFKKKKDYKISHQSIGHILQDYNSPLIFLHTSTCPSSSYCCSNNLVFDTTKDIYIRNVYHSCSEHDDYYEGKFIKKNDYFKILMVKVQKPNWTYYLKLYYTIDLKKVKTSQLKKFKKYFIRTIENKTGKKLSKNAKVVVFYDNDSIYNEDGLKNINKIPYVVIDGNKAYLYMQMSFTSQNESSTKNTRFRFNGKYKLVTDNHTYSSTKIYAPYLLNDDNIYLGYNTVFTFENVSLKKGMELKFIENDGQCYGCLHFNLVVKDVF